MTNGNQEMKSRRKRLPTRRPSVTQELSHAGQLFTISIGFDPQNGAALEVFGCSPLIGSQTAALVNDACVLISLGLQSGLAPAQIAHSLTKQPTWGEEGEQPASVIGAIVLMLIDVTLTGSTTASEMTPGNDHETEGAAA